MGVEIREMKNECKIFTAEREQSDGEKTSNSAE